jgi:RHS repeat-associated protein
MGKTVMRNSLALLAVLLAASPLAAETRFAPAPNATETVSWSSGVTYAYDASGNVRQLGRDTFRYDHAGRLVHATINSVARDYEYDAYGNRTRCIQDASDCQNGLAVDRDTNRLAATGYDGSGNVTSFSGHLYTYDDANMVRSDSFGPGGAKEFIYTADDERIAIVRVGSAWQWTIRDSSGKVLREFASNGANGWSWKKDYVWRDGALLASRQPATSDSVTTYHYHLDHLGSARRVTDQQDLIVGVHDYLAFGPEAAGGTNEPSATSLRFTGHERDVWGAEGFDTLDYMHARYYSPFAGRFLSVDRVLSKEALRRPQRWNRYAYVANNPLKFVDPSGNEIRATQCIVDSRSAACAEQLAIVQEAFGRAWAYVKNDNGVLTLKDGASPQKLGALFGKATRALAYMANSKDGFNLITGSVAAAMAKDFGGARTLAGKTGGANIYIDTARFPQKLGGADVGVAEAYVHEAGHAIAPYFADIAAINMKYAGSGEVGLRGDAFPVFLENAWRRDTLGLPNNDVRVYYKLEGDIRYPGTDLEDIW